uniref:Uncharacterized protein n=1 Tax=Avena sativa TaxID=4498 RepID=A0ACD5VED3_AVESA
MHLFFLCSFSKAAWYCFPWFIKTGIFAQHNSLVPHMIQGLLDSQHPQISVTSLYMFLWCIWKARNDSVFCRKTFNPSQIYAAAMAIMQGTKLEFAASPQFCRDTGSTNPQVYTEHHVRQQDHVSHQVMPAPGSTITNITSFTGPVVFSDAAWTIGSDGQPTPARLGLLQLQRATFLTDSATLAKAAAAQCLILAPGHWTIRLQLARMAASLAFDSSRIYHIPRSYNFRAHHKAKLALKLQNRNFSYRCLTSGNDTCLNALTKQGFNFRQSPVMECTFVHVRCC